MKLVSVEQMRAIEKASDAAGHTYAAMMERAGAAVAQVIMSQWAGRHPSLVDGLILVLVGPGNNGGDGLVAARVLREAGAQVACYLFKPRGQDDPNWVAAQEKGCQMFTLSEDEQRQTLSHLLQQADVIVDALLGTGTARPLEGELAALLQTVAAHVRARRAPPPPEVTSVTLPALRFNEWPLLVAVDGPTGMNYDTGELDPLALSVDLSVTLAYPKWGHARFPAAGACGELIVADIGIDPQLAAGIRLEMADAAMLSASLPARPPDAHKGTFGKVMIVAGSVYYSGAAVLAAQAAYRVGSGLVTLAPPGAIYPAVASRMSETTYLILPDDMGILVPDAVKVLADKMPDYQAILLGPGLSSEKETVAFVHRLFGIEPAARKRLGFQASSNTVSNQQEKIAFPPLVVDADGLNALAQVEHWWQYLPAPTILTPHPGEMARLMKADEDARQQLKTNRWEIAQRMAMAWGHIVVLKGAFTVVAAPDGRTVVLPYANPALATAGSGDVLAGAIVGMLGQGMPPFEAALCGAYLHGLAGELARRELGVAGVVAGDVLARLPQAVNRLREA